MNIETETLWGRPRAPCEFPHIPISLQNGYLVLPYLVLRLGITDVSKPSEKLLAIALLYNALDAILATSASLLFLCYWRSHTSPSALESIHVSKLFQTSTYPCS